MKNTDVALAGEWLDCLDGVRREFRVSNLMMCLIQEHYRNNGQPEFIFYRDFDWDAHFDDPELTAIMLWAGLAYHEMREDRFDKWTVQEAKAVVNMFDIPKIVDVVRKAARKALSEDQRKVLEHRANAKKKTQARALNKKKVKAKKAKG